LPHWSDPPAMVTASPDPMVFEAMNSATLPTSVPAASTDRCSPGPSPAMAPARLGMDPSELVADDGQGDWSHDQVALETVRFEVAGDDPSTPSSPGSRRNVTLSRGTQEAPPLLLSSSASTPIRRVVSVFAADVCRTASPTVLVSTPPRRRAKTPQLPPAPRRSERLAKKSRHRATKPVQQAQNVLMKRLGLTSTSLPPDASSFQRYTAMFSSTMTASQCEAMDALLPTRLSSFEVSESDQLL